MTDPEFSNQRRFEFYAPLNSDAIRIKARRFYCRTGGSDFSLRTVGFTLTDISSARGFPHRDQFFPYEVFLIDTDMALRRGVGFVCTCHVSQATSTLFVFHQSRVAQCWKACPIFLSRFYFFFFPLLHLVLNITSELTILLTILSSFLFFSLSLLSSQPPKAPPLSHIFVISFSAIPSAPF